MTIPGPGEATCGVLQKADNEDLEEIKKDVEAIDSRIKVIFCEKMTFKNDDPSYTHRVVANFEGIKREYHVKWPYDEEVFISPAIATLEQGDYDSIMFFDDPDIEYGVKIINENKCENPSESTVICAKEMLECSSVKVWSGTYQLDQYNILKDTPKKIKESTKQGFRILSEEDKEIYFLKNEKILKPHLY